MRKMSRVGLVTAAACLALGAAALLLLLNQAPPASAQGADFTKVEVKAQLAGGQVYMLTGAGGNIGAAVGEDGVLMVDDQFEPLSDKIRAALKSVGGEKIKFVVNTHWHGDHTGGNKVFGAEAPILAQTNVRLRLASEQTIQGQKIPASPKVALPVVTFDQSVSLHWNGEEIKVVHFPHGHTDGDSIVFFTRSNVVHMGDDFFAGRFPFVDLESGGSVQGVAEAVGKVLAMVPQDAKVIPGHGPLSTVADLKRYHQMLLDTTAIVRQRKAAGKSLDAIQAEGLAEVWKEWGSGFIDTKTWLKTIFNSTKN